MSETKFRSVVERAGDATPVTPMELSAGMEETDRADTATESSRYCRVAATSPQTGCAASYRPQRAQSSQKGARGDDAAPRALPQNSTCPLKPPSLQDRWALCDCSAAVAPTSRHFAWLRGANRIIELAVIESVLFERIRPNYRSKELGLTYP